MKINKYVLILLLLTFSTALYAAPESSGKLAGTETAFIDTSYANIGLMDSTFSFFKVISIKTNLTFDALGLYNIGIKGGYHFKNFFNLRVAAGYTWFYLNEEQFITGAAASAAVNTGITINSLNLGLEGQKIYFALMIPVYGFNINANYGIYKSINTPRFSKATMGLEKTFFDHKLSVYANAGLFFNLPVTSSSSASQAIFFNTLITDFYSDGGIRFYMGDHFNMDLGFIYPGMNIPLGTDPDTGNETNLNLPVIPVFNVAYRF